MPDLPTQTPRDKVTSQNHLLSLRERRKWDGILTLIIFFLVLIASVLFSVLTESEPLIASKDF